MDPIILGPTVVIAATATTYALGKLVVKDMEAPPLTGYQCVQAAQRHLENAWVILSDEKKGAAIAPAERTSYLVEYRDLRQSGIYLEKDTNTFAGSMMNYTQGIRYYHAACTLEKKARVSSDIGLSTELIAALHSQ